MAADYDITDKELQAQIAVGVADIEYLDPGFITSRTDPKTVAALVTMWMKIGMPRQQTLDSADALITHLYITNEDREYVVRMRNTYLYLHKRLWEMYSDAMKVSHGSILSQRLKKLEEL